RRRLLRAAGRARLLGARALRRRALPRQLHARLARLREADGDRLLGRPRAVLPLTDMVHLLAHELARLRARRLALARVLARASRRLSVRHDFSVVKREASASVRSSPLAATQVVGRVFIVASRTSSTASGLPPISA